MKKIELFHPRVFVDKVWADGYYQRNKKNIKRVGERFVSHLKENHFSSGRVLDVGCGFATVPVEIARNFPDMKITGIDLSEPLLELGQSLIEEEGLTRNITLLKGDVQKMDFEDDSFDLVINTFMLHVVENPVKMLNEIERVTKDRGKIMITDLRRIFLGYLVKKLRTSYTLEEALEIIEKSDLREGHASKGPFWWDYMVG